MDQQANIGRIYSKMAAIMAGVEAITKDRKADKFRYRGIDDVYNMIQPLLREQGVWLEPAVESDTTVERENKSGTREMFTRLLASFTFRCEDGSCVKVGPVPGHGMDVRDFAASKAMSQCQKTAILQAFCIPTELQEEAEATIPEKGWGNHIPGGPARSDAKPGLSSVPNGNSGAASSPNGSPEKPLVIPPSQPFVPNPNFPQAGTQDRQAPANAVDTKRAVIASALRKLVNGDKTAAEKLVSTVCYGKTTTSQLGATELEKLRVALACYPIMGGTAESVARTLAQQMDLPPFASMSDEQVAQCWRNIQHVVGQGNGPGF